MTLQLEDHVFYALLWKRPTDRLDYFIAACRDDVGHALSLLGGVTYPKLINPSIARYAAFVADEREPRGVFKTREDAWDCLQDEPSGRVVDVPLVEIDAPRYEEYYAESRGVDSCRAGQDLCGDKDAIIRHFLEFEAGCQGIHAQAEGVSPVDAIRLDRHDE